MTILLAQIAPVQSFQAPGGSTPPVQSFQAPGGSTPPVQSFSPGMAVSVPEPSAFVSVLIFAAISFYTLKRKASKQA